MSPTSSIAARSTCGLAARTVAIGANAGRGSGPDFERPFRPSGPCATPKEGAVYGRTVGKFVIALVVFPVIVHAIFTALTMLLGPMLPTLLALAESWSDLLHKGLIGAAFLVALRG